MTDFHTTRIGPNSKRAQDELLRSAVQSYHTPPATPREKIWERVRGEGPIERPASRRPALMKYLPAILWPSAAVGLLLAGMWLGRFSEAPCDATRAQSSAESFEPSPTDLLQDRLTQNAEALLMLVSSGRPGMASTANPGVSTWAKELLSETRLLLDSPQAEDAQLGALLLDLEFVLVQLVRQSCPHPRDGSDLIQDSIRRKDLLLRLRHAHSPPHADGA